MTAAKMHADEADIDAPLVRRLLTAQFPQWARLPVERVASSGTDNALYRLGTDLAVRLPRIAGAAGQVEKDLRLLPHLAPHLPLTVPAPLGIGAAGEGFPWTWGIYKWLDGDEATLDRLADPCAAAKELARFFLALQSVDTAGEPTAEERGRGRGMPLVMRDLATREAIDAMRDELGADTNAVTAIWDESLAAPKWSAPPVWVHADVTPGNLLVADGRLAAVIDFACLSVGDPAAELLVGWNLFTGESREAFRAELQVDDATWARGRGWALSVALIALPYYLGLGTNPVIVANSRRVIAELIADRAQAERRES